MTIFKDDAILALRPGASFITVDGVVTFDVNELR